ncbi:MAG: DegT/DnrJ/EryC1/StrS aminotransferase family protein [Syntrophales bacterium]
MNKKIIPNKDTRSVPSSPWPCFDQDEIEAAVAVLRSGKVNYWTGEEGRLFEKEFAKFIDVEHAVALMNGTVALEAILYAFEITSGDEVIVTPRSFIASVSCAALRGAKPVFVDVDVNSQNITAENIEKAITPKTKAIIAVHLAGWPCDMDAIKTLADRYNLRIIEDCAQAHGAQYKGKMVGSFGDAAAFSFCQDKIMTTGGEGGMVTTNNRKIWEKIWSYKDHGKSYDAVHNCNHQPGFYWLHNSFGTNLRMTELQSAIGRIQLRKLPHWLKIRRRNAQLLTEGFSKITALRVTKPREDVNHAYYKYYVFVRPEILKTDWNLDRIMNAIITNGIPCFSGSCSEIYLEKAFDQPGLRPPERLPVAKELGETSLMFLVHPTLTEEDMHNVTEVVKDVFAIATKSTSQ